MASIDSRTVVLLVNLGTPKGLTFLEVLKFLRSFLWDHRVVEVPRWIWWFVLHGVVLPLRTGPSLKLYQQIWQPQGSPLKLLTERLAEALHVFLKDAVGKDISVVYGMTYGNPSLETTLKTIEKMNVSRLIVIPLFPQYSATTTAAVFDRVANHFKQQRFIPALNFVNEYAGEAIYQQILVDSIKEYWGIHGRSERLLFSFHGIPLSYENAGDPYPSRCKKMAFEVATHLEMTENSWGVGFQSRFGWKEWVKPYTDQQLTRWADEGVKSVAVVAPSFSVDCLETLEELNIRNRRLFLSRGGESFHYIPALNDTKGHQHLLMSLIQKFF